MLGLNKISIIVMILLLGALFTTCDDTIQGPVEQPESQILILVDAFPDIGVHSTKFEFSVSIFEDGAPVVDATLYTFRWDWENDGEYDTDWLASFSTTHSYEADSPPGKRTVNIAVQDTTGKIDSVFTRVYVQELIRITSNESGTAQGNVSVARDGSDRIAFDWRGPQREEHQIWVLQPSTGVMQQVTHEDDDPATYDYAQYPEWSPDGGRIAYLYERGIGAVNVATGVMSHVVDAPSAVMVYIRWSPDGRFLVYADYGGGGHTYIYDFEEDSSHVFLEEASVACWSPDGQTVAVIPYAAAFDQQKTLQVLDFRTGSVLREIKVPGVERKLDWSPDGKWILLGFLGEPYPGQSLFLVHAETGRILNIDFRNELTYLYQPCWSDDMSLIVFDATERNDGSPLHAEIWAITMPADLE